MGYGAFYVICPRASSQSVTLQHSMLIILLVSQRSGHTIYTAALYRLRRNKSSVVSYFLSAAKSDKRRNLSWRTSVSVVPGCRSADERTSRDGSRRSSGGAATSAINSSTVKRLFTDGDRAETRDVDTKRPRTDTGDGAEVFTLKVCSNNLLL